MNKLNKLKTQVKISLGLLCLLAVVGVGLVVRANIDTGGGTVNIENYNEAAKLPPTTPTAPIEEEAFGASDSASNYKCQNGDCTFYISGDWINASTTIVSIPDPFRAATSTANDIVIASDNTAFGWTGATSTVELVRLNQTGVATSSYILTCGASASPAGTLGYNIITSDLVSTSTPATIENNISSSYGANFGGGSVAKILLTPIRPYLVCKVDTGTDTAYAGAFTEATNTADGKYFVRITKGRF